MLQCGHVVQREAVAQAAEGYGVGGCESERALGPDHRLSHHTGAVWLAHTVLITLNTLQLQALTPLLLELAPTALLAILVLTGHTLVFSPLTFFINWAPVINSLSAILVVRPYRRTLIRLLRKKKVRKYNHIVPISTIDNANMPTTSGLAPRPLTYIPRLD